MPFLGIDRFEFQGDFAAFAIFILHGLKESVN